MRVEQTLYNISLKNLSYLPADAQRIVLQQDRGWKISAEGCYLPAYLPATDTDLPVAGMQLSADMQCAYRYSYAKQLLPRCKTAVTASWK